jgi:hypothetical protein
MLDVDAVVFAHTQVVHQRPETHVAA